VGTAPRPTSANLGLDPADRRYYALPYTSGPVKTSRGELGPPAGRRASGSGRSDEPAASKGADCHPSHGRVCVEAAGVETSRFGARTGYINMGAIEREGGAGEIDKRDGRLKLHTPSHPNPEIKG